MTINHIENATKMHSVYYCAPRWKLSFTQISLHFALLFATLSFDDQFNFARVSIKLIIYFIYNALMKKFLVEFIQLRNMPENVQEKKNCLAVSPSFTTLCDLLSPFTITSVSASHFVTFVILSLY